MKKNDKLVILEKKYEESVHEIIRLKPREKHSFEKEMEKYADSFLRTNFNMRLRIPIKIDGRLTRAGGSFHLYDNKSRRESIVIKMSERYIACAFLDKKDGVEAILDVLRHELVHYALFEQRKGYSDGDHDFESKLAELSIGSSGATADKKRLSKTFNVWYKMLDIYIDEIDGTEYEYNHTKKHQSWIGKRVGVRVIKSIF